MTSPELPSILTARHIHLVGAKGTGMAALAEILCAAGVHVSGSDVADTFYTDAILASLGVPLSVGFDAAHLAPDVDLVIHSAAYSRDSNPELLEARRRGLPLMNYPEALGSLSRFRDSSGIAGVHGKTTTTALTGSLLAGLGLPATVLAGSAVSSFSGRSTIVRGERYFVAETCEYRRHFLNFFPRRIVLTSVESDHQDYYPSYADILAAFVEYGKRLPEGGELIFCADDPGAREAASNIASGRADLRLTPYGKTAAGPFRLYGYTAGSGLAHFRLAGIDAEFELRLPGEHLALDATAAIALALSILRDYRGEPPGAALASSGELAVLRKGLAAFAGSKRRSEIIGEAGGVLFMDDYGHHPTALRLTIAGIKAFWPDRRLVVDFMSHTYSRTKALFREFVESLDEADELVLHKIYPSARETPDPGFSGASLAEAARARASVSAHGDRVSYFENPLDALDALASRLRPGDLFLTMGAGDNWKLGEALLERLRKGQRA